MAGAFGPGVAFPVASGVVDDLVVGPSDEFVVLPADHAGGGVVDEHGVAVLVDAVDAFGGGMEDEFEAVGQGGEGFFGALPLGLGGLEFGDAFTQGLEFGVQFLGRVFAVAHWLPLLRMAFPGRHREDPSRGVRIDYRVRGEETPNRGRSALRSGTQGISQSHPTSDRENGGTVPSRCARWGQSRFSLLPIRRLSGARVCLRGPPVGVVHYGAGIPRLFTLMFT